MALWNNTLKYGSVAKAFHWGLGVAVLGMLAMGLWIEGLPSSPDKLQWVGIHKASGIVILMLALGRLAWKLANTAPLLPGHMGAMARLMARGGHVLLYVLLIGMPLSGWAMSSAAGYPVSVFGWFIMPDLMAPDPQWRGVFRQAHGVMAWAMILVIAGHAAAALLHHFYYRDNVLLRMLPYGRLRKEDYTKSDTMAGC